MRQKLEEARAAAEQMVLEARAEARRLLEAARAEGTAAGEEALASALAELDQKIEAELAVARDEAALLRQAGERHVDQAASRAVSFVAGSST